jgi:hypothetical protein
MPAERLQQVIERQLGDVDGEIEIAVNPSLTPNQCVDTPPAGNPDPSKPALWAILSTVPTSATDMLEQASSPISVTMRLAKQV